VQLPRQNEWRAGVHRQEMSRQRAGQARANRQEAASERTRAAHAMDSNKGKTKPMARLGEVPWRHSESQVLC